MGKVKIKKADIDRYDSYVRRDGAAVDLLHDEFYVHEERADNRHHSNVCLGDQGSRDQCAQHSG